MTEAVDAKELDELTDHYQGLVVYAAEELLDQMNCAAFCIRLEAGRIVVAGKREDILRVLGEE